jgi:hypothetical protein
MMGSRPLPPGHHGRARFDQPIEPVTLGNMRELGVRSLDVSWWNCPRWPVTDIQRAALRMLATSTRGFALSTDGARLHI